MLKMINHSAALSNANRLMIFNAILCLFWHCCHCHSAILSSVAILNLIVQNMSVVKNCVRVVQQRITQSVKSALIVVLYLIRKVGMVGQLVLTTNAHA